LRLGKSTIEAIENMEPPDTSGSLSSSPTTDSATEPPAVRSPNPSVLIVDDVELSRTLLRQFLAHTIFETDEAENGAVAVAMAKHRKYDFILMDLLMPEMDGFEAMRNIRMWEESRGLEPACVIITVTASELKEAVPECFESGADMHLTKPITKEKLLEVLSAQWSRIAARPRL
jgi:CheY-like chemotaxis protein